MLLYIPRAISSDLGDTSGNFLDILHSQILVALVAITNIRGNVKIEHSVACQVKKEVLKLPYACEHPNMC